MIISLHADAIAPAPSPTSRWRNCPLPTPVAGHRDSFVGWLNPFFLGCFQVVFFFSFSGICGDLPEDYFSSLRKSFDISSFNWKEISARKKKIMMAQEAIMGEKIGKRKPSFKQPTFNKENTSVRSPEQCLFHSKDACHCFPNVVLWKPGGSRCVSEPSFLCSSQAWRWISWQAGNASGSWHLRNHHTRSDPAQIILDLWAKYVESSATGDDYQAQSSNQGQHQEPMVF